MVDCELFDEKNELEVEMDAIPKKIEKKKIRPLTYIGMVPFFLGMTIYLLNIPILILFFPNLQLNLVKK